MANPESRSVPGPAGPHLVVVPELAEEIVWRAILRAERAGRPELRASHHDRAAVAYLLPPGPGRDRAFADLAARELEELHLLAPIREAVAERPALVAAVDLVLLVRALSPGEETVTCDPPGRRVGLRVTADRFDEGARARSWARHALGHAEDCLDPTFGFEPGWERGTGGAVAERLHVLWDAAIDGRAARAGRPVFGSSRDGHRARLAALLPAGQERTAVRLVDRCWDGERPSFGTLRRWAEAPRPVSFGAGTVAAWPQGIVGPARLPGGRCPLCRFPSAVLIVPDPSVAATIAAAHPGWPAETGCCQRCHDRYRLVPSPRPRLLPRSRAGSLSDPGGPR